MIAKGLTLLGGGWGLGGLDEVSDLNSGRKADSLFEHNRVSFVTRTWLDCVSPPLPVKEISSEPQYIALA